MDSSISHPLHFIANSADDLLIAQCQLLVEQARLEYFYMRQPAEIVVKQNDYVQKIEDKLRRSK